MHRCPVTGLPLRTCECGACWDLDEGDDEHTEGGVQAMGDEGGDEDEAQDGTVTR